MRGVCFFVLILAAYAAAQNGCSGTPNTLPIYEDAPVFVSSVTNGKFYQLQKVEPPINVIHVYGTPYEMGLAHGQMMASQIQTIIPEAEEYIASQVEQAISELPTWLQELIGKYGSEAALEATYYLTRPYTPQYFYDEIQGIADGSGVDFMRLVRIHMFPELIQAACSMYGAWGPAIANTNGTLMQLRALDWATNGPFQQVPAVIVYHPTTGGHDFAIVTWVGFIGTITGYSSVPMGLCEKVWYAYNGTNSRSGIPWHFLTRDIMQFDNDIDDAINRIVNADRTCSVWLGIGDANAERFNAIGYSYEIVNIWDDQNFPQYPAHPRMNGLVYIDKHVQPSNNPCFGSLMQKYYGDITPENTIRYITALEQTGDMQIAVMDFGSHHMFVANASPFVNGTCIPAYQRPFVRLDMQALFAEQP